MAGLRPEPSGVEECIHAMEFHSVSLLDLIGVVLRPAVPSEIGHQFVQGFPALLHQIVSIERVELPPIFKAIHEIATSRLEEEVLALTNSNDDFHFKATHADLHQVEGFSIPNMDQKLQSVAPALHSTISRLLDSNGLHRRIQENRDAQRDQGGQLSQGTQNGDEGYNDDEDDEDAIYWAEIHRGDHLKVPSDVNSTPMRCEDSERQDPAAQTGTCTARTLKRQTNLLRLVSMPTLHNVVLMFFP